MSTDPQQTGSVGRLDGVVARARGIARIGVYLGLVTVVVGGMLIAIAWGKVAGRTDVGLQTPYLVSAGLSGLALVAVGLSVVSHAARARDARARAAQLNELKLVLSAIATAVENDPTPSAPTRRRRSSSADLA